MSDIENLRVFVDSELRRCRERLRANRGDEDKLFDNLYINGKLDALLALLMYLDDLANGKE